MIKLRVDLDLGRGEILSAMATIDDFVAHEAVGKIKISDGAFPMFDTPQAVMEVTLKARRVLISELAPRIAEVLADALASRDTINGYTAKERER